MSKTMNKAQLIEAIAKAVDLSKTKSEAVVNTFMKTIKTSLKKGQSVVLIGFGTFAVAHRAGRVGRNPRTGDALQIPARKAPVFRAGKAFKEELNK